MVTRPRVGILALQGDFDAHLRALSDLAEPVLVKTPPDLANISGLVMPGGESTTLVKLLKASGLWSEIPKLPARGVALFGTCAGAILLSREVENPAQESLGLLDATTRRNAYGRQVDSFEAEVQSPHFPGGPIPIVCIRAPRFVRVGPSVDVLIERDGDPLLVRQGRVFASTFHPELTQDRRVHRAFAASLCKPRV